MPVYFVGMVSKLAYLLMPKDYSIYLASRYLIGGNDSSRFWPQMSNENEQQNPTNNPHFPPCKRPRAFVDTPFNSLQNQPMNRRMPIQNRPVNPPVNPPVNKGLGKLFFKTRLCAKFDLGICPYGNNCHFAHGIEDIHQPPPNWQQIVASHEEKRITGNWEEDKKIIARMKLCKKFCNGEECPYGDRCNFLHKDLSRYREDPARFRASSAISIGTTGSPVSYVSGSKQPEFNGVLNPGAALNWGVPKPVFWKTRICNNWETTGQCMYGEKCHYAHGLAELQNYGGQIEAEWNNSSMASPKCLNSAIAAPSDPGIGSPIKYQVKNEKWLSKWKGVKKISSVYADWIDDMPLPASDDEN